MPVLVGSASWADKSLIACGRFYPPEATSPEARLRHYASRFPLVEVDSSYYAIPAEATAQRWAERTPEGFTMNVKAFRLFTGHDTSAAVLPRDLLQAHGPWPRPVARYGALPAAWREALWQRFTDALRPLKASGRLGLVHFQFPPWVRCDAAGRAHVALCTERMAGHTVSIEFRHVSWFEGGARTAATLHFLHELGAVHTVVDAPEGPFTNRVPAVWEATHPEFTLLRLHGRNAAAWGHTGPHSSGRFDHVYSAAELDDLAPRIRTLAQAATFTHVVFNTNREDQGQRNALALMRRLEINPSR